MSGERETSSSRRQSTHQHGRWDPLATELHRLRELAGTPSYEALTQRLIAQRIEDGRDPHAARIARSSVHDAFRFGRSRINESLVRELVRVMGGDPRDVDGWVGDCAASARVTPPVPTARPSGPATTTASPPVAGPAPSQVLLLMACCLALNLAGRQFVDMFNLPVYLDMVGTAVTAMALGPWRGATVGALTNIVGIIGSGWISLPFALVNIVGALMWGYGVRRWGMGRTLPRFFALNMLTALACSAVAVPIILTLLGHEFRIGHDAITRLIHERVDDFVVAVGFSNVLTSLGDKLVSGFVALVVMSALPLALRADSQLVLAADAAPG